MLLKVIFGLLLLCIDAFAGEQCLVGDHWVESHHRRAYVRYDAVPVRSTTVNGHCRKTPRGYETWHSRLSNGRPGIWGYTREKSKKWSVEETERFLSAISVLPDKLAHLKGVFVYRMKASKDLANPATSNGRDIVLYDLAFQHKDSLSQIISHELSHIVYRKTGVVDLDRFKRLAGWKQLSKGSSVYTATKRKIFIQEDSRASIPEDFSNHLEHYLFKNDSLKAESPYAYKWIQKEFGLKFKFQEEGK